MLHIVNKSPFKDRTLEQALRHCQAGDSLILVDDASYATQSDLLSDKPSLRLYVLASDIQSRGLQSPKHIAVIDMPSFVDLVFQHDKSISWY